MYIGTHDNDTVKGWLASTKSADKAFARKYCHITSGEGWCWGLIRVGLSTPSDLFVVQMQDVLELSGENRMNTPGIPMGNWCWRMLPGAATEEIAARLADLTKLYGR